MSDWEKDSDHDGVPDVIEDAVEEAGLIAKTFTKRNFYLMIILAVIISGYGFFGYQYMSLRDEKIALQNQFDWQKSENEIEINKARIDERRVTILELEESIRLKREALNKSQAKVDALLKSLNETDEEFNDEVQSMEVTDVIHAFSVLGYNAK